MRLFQFCACAVRIAPAVLGPRDEVLQIRHPCGDLLGLVVLLPELFRDRIGIVRKPLACLTHHSIDAVDEVLAAREEVERAGTRIEATPPQRASSGSRLSRSARYYEQQIDACRSGYVVRIHGARATAVRARDRSTRSLRPRRAAGIAASQRRAALFQELQQVRLPLRCECVERCL